MDGILRQNTAVDVLLGPFVDSTDGDTAETALTIAQADVRLSKNGQNMAQKNDATSCVHDEEGMYNCELDATDTDTVGQLAVVVHETGALHVKQTYQVLDEVAYDSLFATAATILTSADVGLLYESTIATLNSQTSFDMTDALASDDVGIGNVVTVIDAGDSTNFHTTEVTDVDQVNNRIITRTAPAGWTIATTDTVRIYAQAHAEAGADAAIASAALATADRLLAYVQLLARSDAAISTDRNTELGLINTDEGSGVGDYTATADSQEALSDDATAIRNVTDQFVFTIVGEVDVNTQSINDVPVVGTGTSADKWRG